MFFLKKPQYKYLTVELPFIIDDYSIQESDNDRCLIDIEAYGEIDGQMKYFYSSFSLKDQKMYDNGDFESMLNLLRGLSDNTVSIELKYKNGVLKDFKMITESLADALHDERFLKLELSGWGINDKSCREM